MLLYVNVIITYYQILLQDVSTTTMMILYEVVFNVVFVLVYQLTGSSVSTGISTTKPPRGAPI